MTEYMLPPADVVEMLDAPPTPVAIMSPDRTAMLLVDYEPYPPISLLARPILRLGGQRIDPALGCLQRTVRFTGITVVSVADGGRVRVALPEEARTGLPVWSPDGARIAFTRDREDGVELWLAEVATGDARAVPDVLVCDVLCSPTMLDPIGGTAAADPPFTWSRDSRSLLVRAVPPGRGPAPAAPLVPAGPRVQETAGKRSQMATFQDLLDDDRDEALFEHVATAQLVRIEAASGAATPLGVPGMIASVRESPDGRYLLVGRVRRPFSFRVPFPYFARTTEVWDTAGAVVATVADLPVSDEVPRQGVPTGPRGAVWQERRDATLVWSEALDGGDPTVKVPHRDRVMMLAAPFTAAPRELLRATHRVVRWDWADHPDEALLTEFDRDRRWRTTWLLDLSRPDESRRVLFDLSVHDDYGDPGDPVYQTKPDGARTMVQDGDRVYLAGRGRPPLPRPARPAHRREGAAVPLRQGQLRALHRFRRRQPRRDRHPPRGAGRAAQLPRARPRHGRAPRPDGLPRPAPALYRREEGAGALHPRRWRAPVRHALPAARPPPGRARAGADLGLPARLL